ncbi:TPA: hypothetical protein ACF2EA_000238 [Acinetobacter baumannii]
MSEFKVGDCVVYKDSNKYKNHLFKVVDVEDGIAIAVEAGQECFVYFPDMRLAEDTEIAAGHRIDNDMGDDFPIENRISPNCKVTEAHINEADKLNRLG